MTWLKSARFSVPDLPSRKLFGLKTEKTGRCADTFRFSPVCIYQDLENDLKEGFSI